MAAAMAFAVTGCTHTSSGAAPGMPLPSGALPGLVAASSPSAASAPTSAASRLQSDALKLQALAVSISKYCSVGQPFLTSVQSAITDQGALDVLAQVQAEAGKVCTVSAAVATHPLGGTPPTLDLAAVESFANTQVPKLLTLVKNSNLTDSQKTAATLAISGAQAALLLAAVDAR
ncbi:hypothetical protein WJ68_16365 [Burkholderia ubonensis]|uniref:Uncharacterized protein n=2 Tax=Burkholderia ubonensis TaxID=101571 RepID=A0ABD4DZU0_9BURK|nr:hypothetical protein WJ68_16365 [Burkholderia ubonensis]